MTDDFQLFPDAPGDDAIDADIALITAYIARELSPVQIVAVEDRLAKDTAFLAKVRPILEAWALPTPLPAVHAGQGPLSRDEVEAGWTRYVGDHAELDAHEGPRLVVDGAQRKRRKISMTRIAAGIAAVALPAFVLAQVVVYASKHPSVPGHSVAKEMVAPFTEPPPAPPAPDTQKPVPAVVDVPVAKQLSTPKTTVQKAAPVQIPAAEIPQPAPVIPVWAANPDRAKIAELANKHMPEVIRGDTAASYIVMVFDASDNYVWGTFGTGTLRLLIGGDQRTPQERNEFQRAHSIDYTGAMPGARGAGGGGRVGGGARGGGGRPRGDSVMLFGRGARGGGGAALARGGFVGDTGVTYRVDSARLRLNDSATQSVRTQLRSVDSLIDRFQQVVVSARSGGVSFAADSSGGYTIGMMNFVRGTNDNTNTAAGLQLPGNGESGIQGLKATSLTMGEQYVFGSGQLMARPIRIFAIHLAPGTSWNEPSSSAKRCTASAQSPSDTAHDRAGARSTEVWVGYSARSPKWGVLGNRPGMSFGIAAGRLAHRVKTTPGYALDYTVDFVPLAISSPPLGYDEETQPGFRKGSAFGAGFSPLGISAVYRRDRMVQPRLGASGGMLLFDRRVPTVISTCFNFTAMLEAGAQILNHNGDGVSLMYRFHHFSNAGIGYDNSALASHLISVGARFRTGPR